MNILKSYSKIMGTAILLALFLSACQSTKFLKEMEDGIYAQMFTEKGEILLFLEHEKTPITVANFVGLAEGEIENKAKEKAFSMKGQQGFRLRLGSLMHPRTCTSSNEVPLHFFLLSAAGHEMHWIPV